MKISNIIIKIKNDFNHKIDKSINFLSLFSFCLYFFLSLYLLLFISQVVFAQQTNYWLGITLTSLNSNKFGIEYNGIIYPFGDIIYCIISDTNILVYDTDFINIHFLFQNKSLIYGFEFFYETGILRGYSIDGVIFPSIGGVFGIRPKISKNDWLMFESTIGSGIGFIYLNAQDIKYFDFNLYIKFFHTLYLRIYKQIYIYASIGQRYYFFFDKNNLLEIAQGSLWFGLEYKI